MKPQACDKSLRSPSAKRGQSPEPFPTQGAAAQPGHLRVCGGFINKDKAMRRHAHEGQAPRNPESPRLFHISAFLLRRQQRFFLYVNPARQSSRDREAGLVFTPRSASSRAASSGMVMSGRFSTCAIKKSR